MRGHRTATVGTVLTAAALSSTGCHPGLCTQESLNVFLPAVVTEQDSAPRIVSLRGSDVPEDFSRTAFDALRDMIVDGSTDHAGGWWGVGGFDVPESGMAVALSTPFAVGRTLRVEGTVEPPQGFAFPDLGWGPRSLPPGTARVGLRVGEFHAATASGTIAITGVHPLQLELAVVVADSVGGTIRIDGLMEVVYDKRTADCS